MSQATNKEVVSPLSNFSNYFSIWCISNYFGTSPQISLHEDLKHDDLKLKVN